jgi:hypothetical protein
LRTAIVCACLLSATAHADGEAHRASKEIGGTSLILIGGLNATVSVATIGAYLFASCSLGSYGQHTDCVNPFVAGGLGLATGLVALPALAIGITLRRAGDNDAFAAGQSLPPSFFVERAHRRRKVGIPLTLAGLALTATGIGFAGATWDSLQNYRHRDWFPAMISISVVTGVVGVGLLSVGATLATLGK